MKIVLIGDSIRGGYQELVRRKIGGRAEVWTPAENCGHSLMHRENMDRWYLEQKPDVIHFNCGIWDSVPLGDGAIRFTLSTYVRNLRLIVGRLKAEAHARLIFATSTPILEPRDQTPMDKCCVYPTLVRFNRAAVKLMRSNDIQIDDLFAAVMAADPCKCLSQDKVHMTEYGNEVLSDAVVRFIMGQG